MKMYKNKRELRKLNLLKLKLHHTFEEISELYGYPMAIVQDVYYEQVREDLMGRCEYDYEQMNKPTWNPSPERDFIKSYKKQYPNKFGQIMEQYNWKEVSEETVGSYFRKNKNKKK